MRVFLLELNLCMPNMEKSQDQSFSESFKFISSSICKVDLTLLHFDWSLIIIHKKSAVIDTEHIDLFVLPVSSLLNPIQQCYSTQILCINLSIEVRGQVVRATHLTKKAAYNT